MKNADIANMVCLPTIKDVDLSTSIIVGIAISIEDIKGAIIDAYQGIDLLYLLGIKIKENY